MQKDFKTKETELRNKTKSFNELEQKVKVLTSENILLGNYDELLGQ